MRLLFYLLFSFLLNFTSSFAFDLNALNNALDQMSDELNNMDNNQINNDNGGAFNLNQALENASNQEVQWSTHTKKSVGAPNWCPNWNSAQLMERQEAREHRNYGGDYARWYYECGKFYPDAERPKFNIEEACQIWGPENCSIMKQYREYDIYRSTILSKWDFSLVLIAEAIGLKENASGLRATLEFLESASFENAEEYLGYVEKAHAQAIVLQEQIFEKLDSGYIPSGDETRLLQEAKIYQNKYALEWVNVKREKAKYMQAVAQNNNSIWSLLGNLQFMDEVKAESQIATFDKKILEYENTISKSTGKDLNLEDVNIQKEIDSTEF